MSSESGSGIASGDALVLFVVVMALLCLAGMKVAKEADAAVEAGRLAEERQEPGRAVDHYRRAAQWVLPVIGQQGFALTRLLTIAEDAELQGRTELAQRAYRGVRSAILGSRSVWPLDEARLELANQRLAQLMVGQVVAQNGVTAGKMLEVLQRRPGAHSGWAALAVLGLACFLFGGLRLCSSSESPARWHQTRGFATTLLTTGFALFVSGIFAA